MVKRLFVVCSQKENYFQLFAGVKLRNGESIEVDQAPWADIEVVSYTDGGGCLVRARPNRSPFPNTKQHEFRTFKPDIILLRSYALGSHEHDWRRKIYGFYHADIPSVNSIDSFVFSVEKVTLYMKLRRVKKAMPDFPLVQQTYYSAPSIATFMPDFPAVVKVGSSSQGVGKARIASADQWTDTLSLLSMVPEWFVSEPFHKWVSDIRVQKIGTHYRAIERKRLNDQAPWKANEAIGIQEADVPVLDRWRRWSQIDAAAAELGMDMCGMDLLTDAAGKEVILELNSSSIGFPQRHAAEDTGYVRDLVREKMDALWGRNANPDEKKETVEDKEKPKEDTGKDKKEKKAKKDKEDAKKQEKEKEKQEKQEKEKAKNGKGAKE